MSASVMIVDDEPAIVDVLADILQDEGYDVCTCSSAEEALEHLPRVRPGAALLDVWLEGMDGITLLRQLRRRFPETGVIMMSGHGTIDTAVKATREGAFDFIEKPFSTDKLLLCLRNLLDLQQTREENTQLRTSLVSRYQLIGQSPALRELRETIDRVAPTNARVLIQGENGSGKEMIARNLHVQSRRSAGPFVALNCAAIPEELIESELFGHERGAFTSAHQQRIGKFEQAQGGTLFLDEIGDMSLNTQAKVLRCLEDQHVVRIGSNQPISIDVRIISASNKDLRSCIDQQQFREDLYYRLNVVPIRVPALRERREDIQALATYFMEQYCREEGIERRLLTSEALEVLQHHDWPGNVRELKNIVERVLVMSTGVEIRPEQLPDHLRPDSAWDAGQEVPEKCDDLRQAREIFERQFIQRKLDQCEGNVTRAAALMGIDRVSLHKKLRMLGLR